MMIQKTKKTVLVAAATLAMTGCGAGAGVATSPSSGGGGTLTNIVGKVTTSNSSGFRGEKPAGLIEKAYDAVHSYITAPSGCTAYAYDVNGSAALASATVGGDGTFTIESSALTAGSPYKVVTSCSDGTKLSAVVAADSTAAASKTPATVNPVTTLIATQIIKAIITAVSTATSNLPIQAQDAVKAALLKPEFINNIVTAVTTTVQSAIDYGSMAPPSPTAAAAMTDAVAVATDSNSSAVTTAETAYTTDSGKAIPPAITNAVTNSGKSAAALPSCDSTLASTLDNSSQPVASVDKCIQAVAKLIYNDVHFQVGVKLSGGAFGNVACSSNDAKLGPAFPNAKFTAHTGTAGADNVSANIPSGMCAIQNTTPSLDRNRSYDSGGKDGGDHMVFFESFSTYTGVLTALGTALYNNYKYRLSNLDQITFGYGASTGGMNARLLYVDMAYDFANNGNITKTYKQLSTSGGVNSVSAYSGTWPMCGGGSYSCSPGDIGQIFGSISADWTGASSQQGFATWLAGSAWTGSVYLLQYGGPIPNFESVKTEMINAKTHSSYNRTGQAKFNVLYSEPIDWNDPNCQWNNTTPISWTQTSTGVTSTKCLSTSGSEEPVVRVNVVLGTPDNTTGLSQITHIVKSDTGKYFLVPQTPNGSFSGLFQFLDSTTGRLLVDEEFKQRAVFVVTTSSSQAGQHGVPGGAQDGYMYNAEMTWNCSSQPCTISYTVGAAQQTRINATAPSSGTAYTMTVDYNRNMTWSNNGPGLVAAGRSDGANWTQTGPAMKAIFVDVDQDSGAVTNPTLASSAGSTTIPSGKFGIQQSYSCTGGTPGNPGTCTFNGYMLIAQNGTPFEAAGALADGTKMSVSSQQWCPQGGGTCVHPTLYTDAYFTSLGSVIPWANAGNGLWQNVTRTVMIPSGPAANPTFDCTMNPFFIDANSNGTIDHTTNPTTGQPICSEVSFSNTWDASSYVAGTGPYQGQAHPGATIAMNRENSYQYGDPAAVIALLQKAFGPLMDGQHSLTATTDLNALQAFGLLYMLMSQHSDFGTHLEGILTPENNKPRTSFEIVTPVCGDDAGACNGAIGKGFLNYHQ